MDSHKQKNDKLQQEKTCGNILAIGSILQSTWHGYNSTTPYSLNGITL